MKLYPEIYQKRHLKELIFNIQSSKYYIIGKIFHFWLTGLKKARENISFLANRFKKGQTATLVTIYVPRELWQPQFSSSA